MASEQTALEIRRRYTAGLAMLGGRKDIPAVFRAFYQNAVIPYDDEVVLRGFLNIIDRFDTGDTENIGDAYETMLQYLGAQASAGQFRTPRHIIDFIVAIVDPQQRESILDPACGTGGFLASAWQHINRAGDLTAADRSRLAGSIVGYDISPDMARLASINLYLSHGQDPDVSVYDTLTHEDRWNDHYDVILANPPFMSPKGGIRPHQRYSISSRRSEVLFVDYIMGHLNERGRAGVIVPEGVIFQQQRGHTELRRLLVDTCLVAVVSLPGGVFQPYSGVKTSILIMDKALGRKTDRIAFFKVENDGRDLGAQRRPIAANDLPTVQAEIAEYLRRLRAGEPVNDFEPTLGLVVAKDKIAGGGEYNLSGERYRESRTISTKFEMVSLGEVCEIRKGTAITRKEVVEGAIPVIAGGQSPSAFHNKSNQTGETITVSASGAYAGFVAYFNEPIFASDCSTIKPKDKRLISAFIFHALKFKQSEIYSLQVGMGQPHVYPKDLSSFQIPLPPLEVQREIVAEIEGYQRVIDGARAVVDNYRPHIAVDPEWPLVEIGELTKPQYGFTASAEDKGDTRFIRITDIAEDGTLRTGGAKFITLTNDVKKSVLAKGDVLVARTGATFGKTMIFEGDYPAVFASYLIRLRFPHDRVIPSYYWAYAQSESYWNQAKALATGGGQPQFNGGVLQKVTLPLPPLETQQAIVAEIEAEQAAVDHARDLAARMQGRIDAAIGRVWGEFQDEQAKPQQTT